MRLFLPLLQKLRIATFSRLQNLNIRQYIEGFSIFSAILSALILKFAKGVKEPLKIIVMTEFSE